MTTVVKNENNIVCNVMNITGRNLNIIHKYFQVYFEKMNKKLTQFSMDREVWDELNDDHYSKRSSEDFPFTCEFVIKLTESENNIFKLYCNLSVNNKRFHTFPIDRNDVTEFIHNLDFLQQEYRICKCGALCEDGKDQCKNCWIYDYEHEEDCSICMENNYIWEKLDCGHCFHRHCLNKLHRFKCPLCRQDFHQYTSRKMM